MSKETAKLEYNGVEIIVTGDYYKGSPGKWTLSNGDPGYPAEPPEFEIEKIECDNIVELISTIETFYDRKLPRIKEDVKSRIRQLVEKVKQGMSDIEEAEMKEWCTYGIGYHESFTEELSVHIADKIQNED